MRTIRMAMVVALAAMVSVVVAPVVAGAAAADDVRIEVLSNRADVLSGGDALVEVLLPDGVDGAALTVDLDGTDVSDAFSLRSSGRIIGLLDGLEVGENLLTAQLPDGRGARITLTNHPIGGPVFSGPQVQPWVCTTADNGLGEPQDEQCNAPTTYEYHYWSEEEGAFAPYDPDNPPEDVTTTTTDDGDEVPYIVQVEKGTINRGLYQIATLFDPEQPWEPWAPQAGWTGRLFYPFGASCNTNYSQGAFGEDVLVDQALSRGIAVASSGLNTLGQNCNTVTSAETVVMVKERVVEHYGEIRYTFGRGGSGGSIGQYAVANAYPGTLQGLLPSATYPDSLTTGVEVFDCHQLNLYFNTTSPHLWAHDTAGQTAVNGHEGTSSCLAWEALFARIGDPTSGCGLLVTSAVPTAGVPTPDDYNPATNPGGCRATVQDMMKGVLGTRDDGFGKALYDNVGVQYGLVALEAGEISIEQFLDLNEKIGGFDIDMLPTAERAVADPGAPEAGHRSAVNDTRQLEGVAIIDLPPTSNVEIHTPYHVFSIDRRMEKAYGHHENHVTWRGGPSALAFDTMIEWLDAVTADDSDATDAQKVLRHRPEVAVDSCFVDGEQITDEATCDEQYPYYGDARIAAGAPFEVDILKCSLRPLDRDDYETEFTDQEWTRMLSAFPDGVCDYSVPGVGQVPSVPWQTYAGGPGGEPLGPAPVSEPFGPSGTAATSTSSGSVAGSALPATGGGVAVLGLAAAIALAGARRRRPGQVGQRRQGGVADD